MCVWRVLYVFIPIVYTMVSCEGLAPGGGSPMCRDRLVLGTPTVRVLLFVCCVCFSLTCFLSKTVKHILNC